MIEDFYNQVHNTNKAELLNQIKNGIKKSIDLIDNITVDDLLKKDQDGISYLEYALMHKANLSELCEEIGKSKEALYLCAKYSNGVVIQYLRSSSFNEDVLFETIDDDKKIIDIIFSNYRLIRAYIAGRGDDNNQLIKKHPEIVDYFIKYNITTYSLSDAALQVLCEEKNRTLLEKYLKDPVFVNNVIAGLPVNRLYEISKSLKDSSILKYASAESLIEKIDGETVLDRILDSGATPLRLEYGFTNKEILDILIKKNRFDLLYNASPTLLFQNFDSEKTYFDLMIDAHKQGVDVHFERLIFNIKEYPSELSAQVLLKMAKNGLRNYLPLIPIKDTLYKPNGGKSVMEHMLEIDRDTTIDKFISKSSHYRPEVTLELASLGIEVGALYVLDGNISDLHNSYFTSYTENYAKGCENNCEALIKEFSDLYSKDGLSDQKVIDGLISNYKYLSSVNLELASLELEQLIAIKKNNHRFHFKSLARSCFSSSDEAVYTKGYMEATNHEISHALHYYLDGFSEPDNYLEVIQNVRNNPETLKNVRMFSEMFLNLKRSLESSSKDEIDKYYTDILGADGLRFKLSNYFKMKINKEKTRQIYKDDFDPDVLSTVLDKSYSVDEYISQSKELASKRLTDIKLQCEYGYYIEIADIIDAVYQGYYADKILKDENNKLISACPAGYGHGTKYFADSSMIFKEMIADYGSIIKSKNAEEALKMLRNIVGDELVDMLDDYYMNTVLRSNTYLNKKESEVIDHGR